MNSTTNLYRLDLQSVSLRLHGRLFFRNLHWSIADGERWAVIGGNGAGKTALLSLLCNRLHAASGEIRHGWEGAREKGISVVSFERQRELCEADSRHDISEFMENASDPGTTVGALLRATGAPPHTIDALVARLDIGRLLPRGLRVISSGEMRRALFAECLLRNSELLILDNPYEGIDTHSRQIVADLVEQVLTSGHLLFMCRAPTDLPDGITHLLVLDQGEVIASGERQQVLALGRVQALFDDGARQLDSPVPGATQGDGLPEGSALISLRRVRADYGDVRVLENVNLHVLPGEHLALAGPNGSGKSTLLSLICGDNPRAYGQDIHLFGRRRGSGESVWDIKRRFGTVSNQIHMDYPKRTRAFDVVASGFFDSLGLYTECSPNQRRLVTEWLALLAMENKARTRFDSLSFGEQRLLLIARAMIKLPPVLILDEPCSGLDGPHRRQVIRLIDHIAATTATTIIYVSHELAEIPSCIRKRVAFQPQDDSSCYALTEV